jgi:hypothetical protein
MTAMNRRLAIWSATAAALVVALAAYFYAGANTSALAFVARNTARFSGFIFVLALIARSPRSRVMYTQRWGWFWAFIAAHGVHFMMVLAVVFFDATHPLHQLSPKVVLTLASGFGIVLATALTAGGSAEPFRSRSHTFFFYVVAALFAVAFTTGVRTTHPFSVFNLGALVLALLYRALPAKHTAAAAA